MVYRFALSSAILLLFCATAFPDENKGASPLVLSRMGLMYVGGREIPMEAAASRSRGRGAQTQIVEQAPVHFLIPPEERRKNKTPIVMIPGMGLTSYLYLGAPDGRDGWAQLFAKAGHPVYVFDEPNNAVAGFDVSSFSSEARNQNNAEGAPRFMLWPNEIAWRRWGIGSEPGVPFEDTRYPVKYIWQLYASFTPVYQNRSAARPRSRPRATTTQTDPASQGFGRGRRRFGATAEGVDRVGRFQKISGSAQKHQAPATRWGGGRTGGARSFSRVKSSALVELLEAIGPATLIVHSASGSTGFEATRARPDLVNAIVAVEALGCPTDPEDVRKNFADKWFIGLFGDHFEVRPMAGRYEACKTTAKIINKTGGSAEIIRLPDLGIRGNTHLMMQDTNNDEIAQMIEKRLRLLGPNAPTHLTKKDGS